MGSVSTEGVMRHYVDILASRTVFKNTFKMVDAEGCFNLFTVI